MKLIIHHHALVYKDEFGYWFPSFIGSWLDEISNQFDKVAFVGEFSQVHLENQDYLINKKNFEIFSIGIRGKNTSKWKRKKIYEIGLDQSSNFDHLLIRGITPRQYQVFKAFKRIKTSFILVGSLVESKPGFAFKKENIILLILYYLRKLQVKIISRKSHMYANSPQIVEEFRIDMGIKANFIPTNTIRLSYFEKFKFRGFRKEPILLFCGRVVKEKGIEELILSVEQLKKEGRFIYLKIVGSVKESYKKYLNCLILQLGIENQVSFEGFIKFGNELLSLYRSSDIYILPSYHEGFPHSIWEASLTCTPIIVTKVGGIPGLVNDEMVYFIESKSVSSIVGAINHLLSDEIYSESLAQNIYRQCQKYTIEKCIEILKQTITENE